MVLYVEIICYSIFATIYLKDIVYLKDIAIMCSLKERSLLYQLKDILKSTKTFQMKEHTFLEQITLKMRLALVHNIISLLSKEIFSLLYIYIHIFL